MSSANKFSDEYLLDVIRSLTVETFFAENEEKRSRPLADGIEDISMWKELDKRKDPKKNKKWSRCVLDDLKLLWNISLNVDIPAFENYETMCLFDNHWSTTVDDLEILRRSLDRGVGSPVRGFRIFGGHWLARTKPCDQDDCFFGGGRTYRNQENDAK